MTRSTHPALCAVWTDGAAASGGLLACGNWVTPGVLAGLEPRAPVVVGDPGVLGAWGTW
ncbi:hypothetical protein ACFOSC_13345 [Streptantibioticus rubrisoli]|uniref:Uncharacterized protein n=1 Tax=Streptantibioticus rubrisoli TaxID=1387313 RepID=A0ABT1PCK6_9ACTN|nr:hypothetical protein [Streptantibioticus rubrisoli]MCQ4043079.1 hypothetical protein [Streptantibioticus rubrisoli]